MQDIKQQEEMNKRFDVMIDNIYEFGNYNKNLNPYLKSFIQSEISLAVEQLKKEVYTKGFKDGFFFSAEGFNGEYTHPDTNLTNELKEQIDFNLSTNKE